MAESEIHQKDILELFDGRLHTKDRYFYPMNERQDVEEATLHRFRTLRDTGRSITLVDGAFDVPHNNHEWYLRHCKVLGAYASLKATGGHDLSTSDLKTMFKQDSSLFNQHKLAVTVDADEKIAYKKSGLEAKGGVQRPVYPWQARADRLAGYHLEYQGQLHQTVDLVAVEGDSMHRGTPLESSLALAAFLKSEQLLDTFIVYGEHSTTIDDADNLNLDPIVIGDNAPYELNPQTGESWSSSSIIRRAQGGQVAFPVTRPDNYSYMVE